MSENDLGGIPEQGGVPSSQRSAAQAAAAKAAYEDVQASTGGESRPGAGAPTESPAAEPVEDAPSTPTDREPDVEAPGPVRAGAGEAAGTDVPGGGVNADASALLESAAADLAAERLADLQRLQAEYVNYKRRVDRDRALESERAIAGMLEALLPVLDEIHLARQHGELESGPFAKIAEKFEGILAKYGLERYGEPGETFDPTVHEAVMHMHAELAPGTTDTTVVQIMQPGYRLGERIIRPALVAVADPQ